MTMRSLALPLALLLARQVSAHGGHEAVPEGQAISADPIVSLPAFFLVLLNYLKMHFANKGHQTGCDVMDPYDLDGGGLRHNLSFGHGSGGKQAPYNSENRN